MAVADPAGSIASPLVTVAAGGDLRDQAEEVLRAVTDYDVNGWVVGLPLNMDGTDSDQTRLTRRFAETLERIAARPVHLWDERLSSHQADALLAQARLSRKQRATRRDRLAAQVILQSFLDARAEQQAPDDTERR